MGRQKIKTLYTGHDYHAFLSACPEVGKNIKKELTSLINGWQTEMVNERSISVIP